MQHLSCRFHAQFIHSFPLLPRAFKSLEFRSERETLPFNEWMHQKIVIMTTRSLFSLRLPLYYIIQCIHLTWSTHVLYSLYFPVSELLMSRGFVINLLSHSWQSLFGDSFQILSSFPKRFFVLLFQFILHLSMFATLNCTVNSPLTNSTLWIRQMVSEFLQFCNFASVQVYYFSLSWLLLRLWHKLCRHSLE